MENLILMGLRYYDFFYRREQEKRRFRKEPLRKLSVLSFSAANIVQQNYEC